eukprot:6341580-Amphidinium_carterae.1
MAFGLAEGQEVSCPSSQELDVSPFAHPARCQTQAELAKLLSARTSQQQVESSVRLQSFKLTRVPANTKGVPKETHAAVC